MNFNRAKSLLFSLVVLSLFLFTSCSSPFQSANPPESQEGNSEYELALCSSSPEFAFFDLQAAAVMTILIGEDELGQLGLGGAADFADDLITVEESICGLDISDELLVELDEIRDLINSGQESQAWDQIEELLQDIEDDEFSVSLFQKNAAPSDQRGRERTRRKVQALLAVAGRADYWGNDEKFQDALDSARKTYEGWASEVVDSTTIREALRIAAEAQILSIAGLDDRALERARDLAELDITAELSQFNPCSATKKDATRLIDTAALASLLGVEVNTYEVTNLLEEWLDIKRRRAAGGEIPECEGWVLQMEINHLWDSGDYYITWDGRFIENEDGSLSGKGTGSIQSYTEVLCVNVMTGEEFMSSTTVTGSFDFVVEGKRDGSAEESVFKLFLPAEVTVNGVDTCNEFDPVTYLPAYVIEEIHTAGGVENYDLNTDQIYLVISAEDGAEAEFESIIGPMKLTLSSMGEDK